MRKDCKTTVHWEDNNQEIVMSYYKWSTSELHWGVRPISVNEISKNRFDLVVEGTQLFNSGVRYTIKNVSYLSLETKGLRYLIDGYLKNRCQT